MQRKKYLDFGQEKMQQSGRRHKHTALNMAQAVCTSIMEERFDPSVELGIEGTSVVIVKYCSRAPWILMCLTSCTEKNAYYTRSRKVLKHHPCYGLHRDD